jgi:pimeloyl-ACP methyl ester carboxylesterase
VRGYAQPPITLLEGEQLGDIAWEDARAFTVVTRSTLNRLKKTDEGVPPNLQALSNSAFAAFEKKDNYRAYRLFIRFMAMTRDSSSGEGTELAASYNLVLNRTITNTGDTLHVQLNPLFTLGQPLSGEYTARLSLRGTKGVVDERTLPISSIRAFDCALSTADLPEGRAGVRYELRDPDNKLLLRVTRAFWHTDAMSSRLKILQTRLKTLQRENIASRGATQRAATETIEYIVAHLEEMHTKYVGDLRRTAQPMVMKYRGGGRGLTWRGPINIPADIDLAETLSSALLEGKDPLKKSSGDFHLAYRSAVDSLLVPYRIFVPEGYTPDRSWPLIIGLHGASGSENTWLDRRRRGDTENLCKRLSQERGYVFVSPSGRGPFTGYRRIGGQDVMDVLVRALSIYNIDPERVYLTGHSMGGGGTWILGLRHAEKFAAIAPIAASGRWVRSRHVKPHADLPVLFSQGAKDMVALAEPARRTAKLLAKYMKNFTYNETPDDTHNTIWYTALPTIFDFFDAHGRKEKGEVEGRK